MSDPPTDNDLIERYLLGEVTEKEGRAFQARLENDREFARKFRLIKMFPEMMSEPGRIEFEKRQAEETARGAKKRSLRLRNRRYLIWAAVSAIVLTGATLFFIFSGEVPRKEPLIQKEIVAPKKNIVQTKIAVVRDTLPPKLKTGQPPAEQKASEVRSDPYRKAIELLTPADGMRFSREEMILFNWTMKTDSFTRFYIFSEARDKVMLWRGIRPGIRENKIPGNTLFPGKYYWYVGIKEQKRSFIIF